MTINKTELKLILKALEFAALKHKDQKRKDVDASPYINHPISLASVLCNEAHVTDVNTICGAFLHDTIEDTDTSARELETEFGVAISNIVLDVTDDAALDKSERKQKQIERAAHISDKAKLVKLADKICNLRDILSSPPARWSLEKKQGYFDWAKNVIDRLRGVNPHLEAIFDDVYANRPA